MSAEELSLRWQDHHEALLAVFENLLRSNTLVDCTLAAEGKYLKAHKVVLSACSPYFQLLFKEESEKHPIIILKDVKFWTLKAVIDFVYCGEVKIRENQLGAFLECAESLQIKGLGSGSQEDDENGDASNLPEHSRDTSASPTPRKRFRRHRTSASDGENRVTESQNSNFQFSNQTQRTEAVNTSFNPVVSTSTFSAVSNTDSVSGTRTNVKYDTNQSSKTMESSEKSLRSEHIPVIKVEPESEPYQEEKTDFGEEANDFMDDTSAANDVDDSTNMGTLHEQTSNQGYSDFTQSYGETDDLNGKQQYLSGQDMQHSSSQELSASKVEMVDLSSDDSSFHVPSTEHSNPGHVPFGLALSWRGSDDTAISPPTPMPPTAAALADLQAKLQRGWKHVCPLCRKRFITPTKLARHIRSHTGEKPYSCSVCGRAFRQSAHLRSHEIHVHRRVP